MGTVRLIALIGLSLFLVVTGCGDKIDPLTVFEEPPDDGNGETEVPVTYTTDIKAILDANCLGCHSITRGGPDRNGAPVGVDFDTFNDAVSLAERANLRIQSGTMPPDGVGLTNAASRLFQTWIEDGLLEDVPPQEDPLQEDPLDDNEPVE